MKQTYDNFFDFLNMVERPQINENPKRYGWKSTDFGFMKSFDTHGIPPEDINVDVKSGILNVFGENSYNDTKYQVDYKEDLPDADSVENVSFESKNGVTYVYVKLREPKDNSIKVNRM